MLEDGYTIITDRYYFSSYAYQGTHMPLEWVIEANSLSADLLRPDLNIYIDISPEAGMERLKSERSAIELYETVENLQNVRTKYNEAIEMLKLKENVFVIDGNRAPHVIAAEIWSEVSNKMIENVRIS
jgi:dTMP kinase